MWKKIIITAAVILLLLLFFLFGFMEYRQYNSYKTPIHQDADLVVKINADAFIKSFLKEYGVNFRKKIKTPDKKDTVATGNTGIWLPGNIFFYNLKSRQSSTFFCTIPLTNEADFKLFLSKRTGISFSAANEGTAYDGKLTAACSKEYAAIAWSEQKEEVKSVLSDLLAKKNLLATHNALISQLKKNRSHIVFVKGNANGFAEFTGNEIKLYTVVAITKDFQIPEQSIKSVPDTNNYASFFINMKPAVSAFSKEFTVKEYTAETDSLLKYFDGYAGVAVSGSVMQTDTITTYDFDDNFEKTERKTATIVSVPAIQMTIKNKKELYNYLQKQQFITPSQTINREVFPLYKVSARQPGESLILDTDDKHAVQPRFGNTVNFMEADINFKKLQPLTDSTVLKKYTNGINGIHITGRKGDSLHAVIEGRILFAGGALRTLTELIKSW